MHGARRTEEAVAHRDSIGCATLLWLHTTHPVGPWPFDGVGWQGVLKTCFGSEAGDCVLLDGPDIKQKKTKNKTEKKINQKLEVARLALAKENQPFSKWISLRARSDNEWELAIKTPLCTLYTNVPTFPHTCFDMQIAMKEIWKHSCPLLTNT